MAEGNQFPWSFSRLENGRNGPSIIQSWQRNPYKSQENKKERTTGKIVLSIWMKEQFFTELSSVDRTMNVMTNSSGIVVDFVVVPSRMDFVSEEVDFIVFGKEL